MKTIIKLSMFVGGIFLLAVGVVFSSVAGLGIAPPSAPAYAFEYLVELGPGNYIIIMNFVYVFVQLIILRTRFKRFQFLQLFFGLILGFFIDTVTPFMTGFPTSVGLVVAYSLISVLLVALGVSLIILADVFYPPLEGMQKVIADELKVPLAKVKIPIDLLHVLLALVAVIFNSAAMSVIGIGTIFQALTTGLFVQYFLNKLADPIKKVI